ncbi:DNA-formamidopyrimidine glycosylase family protein [Microbacterium sp. X-17]|uniref:DNA-formamidopyrimidine glycosylase family protein n=1 Tax=Microbacterium sp. X-17 TaxID=3144404 RepID=UPI0031F55870
MPESPEVQALAEFLDESLTGRHVAGVDVVEFRAIKTHATPPESLAGAEITGVGRIGKHLDIALGSRHLVVSLGRHGWVRWGTGAGGEADGPPTLVRFDLDDASALELTDAGDWVSAGVSVVNDPTEVSSIAKLGPDPADPAFDPASLRAALGRRKQVKALLQEQETLAGIGGAYSDEILYDARISPVARASDLDDAARGRLVASTMKVVRDAIVARRGIPIDQLKAAKVAAMWVHGRTGRPCPDCGGTVADVPGSKGAAQYCPACQTGGVVLS